MKSVARITFLLLITPLLFLSAAQAQDDPPNLTGNWVLNEKESDDFAEVMREAMGGSQGRGGGGMQGGGKGGGRGGGRGGGGGGGRGGGMGDSEQDPGKAAKTQQRLTRAREEYSRLEIFHDGIELNVTNGLDITRLLFTDGRQMNIWTQQGEAKATATWQKQTLIVEWKTRQDTMNRIRYYTLSDGGQQLTMTESRRLPGKDKPVKITMVYDRNK